MIKVDPGTEWVKLGCQVRVDSNIGNTTYKVAPMQHANTKWLAAQRLARCMRILLGTEILLSAAMKPLFDEGVLGILPWFDCADDSATNMGNTKLTESERRAE